jgi:protoporphyrinogen oxidase
LTLLDNICRSSCTGTTSQLSALAGYAAASDLDSRKYVFEGGNSAITKALIEKLGGDGAKRCLTNCFVFKIEVTEDGVSFLYSKNDGTTHKVKCRHLIVTTPPLVAWRMLSNLDNKSKANLMGFHYGSYLVANCLLKKKVLAGDTYENWVIRPQGFSDIVVAERAMELNHTYEKSMGSVLTIYQPYAPGSQGRPLLLAGDSKAVAKATFEELSPLVDHLSDNLEEIALTRWGHAMAVPAPGYFAKLQKIIASYSGPFTFAHNSMQGLPSAEAAIRAAKFAANRAMKPKAVSFLVPSGSPTRARSSVLG